MKKHYEAPQAEVINLAAMERIALLPNRSADDDGDHVIGPSSTGTGDRDDF